MKQQYGDEVANEFAAFVYNQKYAMKDCVEREGLDCEFEMRRSFDVFLDEREAKEATAWFQQCLKEGHEWTHECDWIDEKHVEQVIFNLAINLFPANKRSSLRSREPKELSASLLALFGLTTLSRNSSLVWSKRSWSICKSEHRSQK